MLKIIVSSLNLPFFTLTPRPCFGFTYFRAVQDELLCHQPRASECSLARIRSLEGEGNKESQIFNAHPLDFFNANFYVPERDCSLRGSLQFYELDEDVIRRPELDSE